MTALMKKFLIGATVAAGISAIATAPASAFSIAGNNDILLYDADGSSTFLNPNANLSTILAGNSSSPGGNVELFASSESVSLQSFLNSTARTSIVGTVAGQTITVSSLTATDWFGPSLTTSFSANTFATQWFNAFYTESGLVNNEAGLRQALAAQATTQPQKFFWTNLATSAQVREAVYRAYLSDQVKGFQRSSDPNISYITTSGTDLLIGLAGHYDAKAFYASQLGAFGSLIRDGFQVSEVVKVNYGGVEQLLYSFSATRSGLVNDRGTGNDGRSHTGNYEVKLAGVVTPPPPSADVPEPSAMLALLGLAGFFAAKRKQMKNA